VSIKWRNGPHSRRNVYIYGGALLILIQYHKARTSTNRSFWVARFLPQALREILFTYLVYLRPLLEEIRDQLFPRKPLQTDLLYTDLLRPVKPSWSSSQVTKSLWVSSKDASMHFTLSNYRHVVTGIVRQHIKPIATPFHLHDEALGSGDLGVVFSWQTSHRPR
jgi:hypothetical protein